MFRKASTAVPMNVVSAKDVQQASVLYSGSLKKQDGFGLGGKFKRWHQRYVQLSGNKMLCYKDGKIKQVIETVNLDGATINICDKKEDGCCLELFYKAKSDYVYFLADTPEDCRKWLSAIRLAQQFEILTPQEASHVPEGTESRARCNSVTDLTIPLSPPPTLAPPRNSARHMYPIDTGGSGDDQIYSELSTVAGNSKSLRRSSSMPPGYKTQSDVPGGVDTQSLVATPGEAQNGARSPPQLFLGPKLAFFNQDLTATENDASDIKIVSGDSGTAASSNTTSSGLVVSATSSGLVPTNNSGGYQSGGGYSNQHGSGGGYSSNQHGSGGEESVVRHLCNNFEELLHLEVTLTAKIEMMKSLVESLQDLSRDEAKLQQDFMRTLHALGGSHLKWHKSAKEILIWPPWPPSVEQCFHQFFIEVGPLHIDYEKLAPDMLRLLEKKYPAQKKFASGLIAEPTIRLQKYTVTVRDMAETAVKLRDGELGVALGNSFKLMQNTVIALNESKRQSEAEAGVNWLIATVGLPTSILSIAHELKTRWPIWSKMDDPKRILEQCRVTTSESDISDLYVIVLNFFVLVIKEKVQAATRKRTYSVKKMIGLNVNYHRIAVEWLGTNSKKLSLGTVEARALQKATDANSNAAIRVEMLLAWKFLIEQSHNNRSLFLQRPAEGAVPSMLILLRTSLTDFKDGDDVEVAAIQVIAVLATHDDGRSAVISGGFVGLLVDMLSNVNDTEIVNIVRTMHHLTAVESYRQAVKVSGVVIPLRAILNQLIQTHESGSAFPVGGVETAVNCATVLLFVGEDSDISQGIAAVEKVLETRQGLSQILSSALISALVRIAETSEMQLRSRSVEALRWIAGSGSEAAATVVKAGAVPLIVALLADSDASSDSRVTAINALLAVAGEHSEGPNRMSSSFALVPPPPLMKPPSLLPPPPRLRDLGVTDFNGAATGTRAPPRDHDVFGTLCKVIEKLQLQVNGFGGELLGSHPHTRKQKSATSSPFAATIAGSRRLFHPPGSSGGEVQTLDAFCALPLTPRSLDVSSIPSLANRTRIWSPPSALFPWPRLARTRPRDETVYLKSYSGPRRRRLVGFCFQCLLRHALDSKLNKQIGKSIDARSVKLLMLKVFSGWEAHTRRKLRAASILRRVAMRRVMFGRVALREWRRAVVAMQKMRRQYRGLRTRSRFRLLDRTYYLWRGYVAAAEEFRDKLEGEMERNEKLSLRVRTLEEDLSEAIFRIKKSSVGGSSVGAGGGRSDPDSVSRTSTKNNGAITARAVPPQRYNAHGSSTTLGPAPPMTHRSFTDHSNRQMNNHSNSQHPKPNVKFSSKFSSKRYSSDDNSEWSGDENHPQELPMDLQIKQTISC